MMTIKGITKTYQQGRVFENFSLSISAGELLSIYGPNGCGKTTFLNLIAGLADFEEGSIQFNNQSKYRTGYIFQNYRESLFPWLTVIDNIAFPLKLKKSKKQLRRVKAQELLEKFAPYIPAQAYPYQLSGGQQQLIALLRNLIIQPDIYLLDEPFSSLDHGVGLNMLEKSVDILKKEKKAAILVSHNADEAVFFADRIVILAGRPAKIVKIINNDLPFPRTKKILSEPRFIELKNTILNLINN